VDVLLLFIPLVFVIIVASIVAAVVLRVRSNNEQRLGRDGRAGMGFAPQSPAMAIRPYSKTVIAAPILAFLVPIVGLFVSMIALRQTSVGTGVPGRRVAVISAINVCIGIVFLSDPGFRSHTYFG